MNNKKVVENAHIHDPVPKFPVASVIGGIPCIEKKKTNFDNNPFRVVEVYNNSDGKVTKEHWIPGGLVQEVHTGDFIAVFTRQGVNSPLTIDSYYVLVADATEVIATHAIL